MQTQPLGHTSYAVIPAPLRRHSRTPPPSFPHPSAVIPAPLRRHSRTPRRHSRTPPPSFLHPSAVIPAVFKRESLLDYAGVNPAYSNWISAYKACPCRL